MIESMHLYPEEKKRIAEYICVESPNEVNGGLLVREQELIRCKDCFWYRSVELKADGTHDKRFKPSRCVLWNEDMNDTDFCSYANAMEKNDEKEKDERSD